MARPRWEWKTVDRVKDWLTLANELGAQGWELVEKQETRWMPPELETPEALAALRALSAKRNVPGGWHHLPDSGWAYTFRREWVSDD